VLDQPDKTEASALTAFNELWNDEQQAADKAAAKKAKKLKQKVKKHQAQSSPALSPSLRDSPSDAGPSQTGQEPCQKGQEPSQIGQEPSSAGQEPSTSGQESYPFENEATSVQRQLFRSETESAPAENRPSCVDNLVSQLAGEGSLEQADSDQHASAAPHSTPPLATITPVRPLSETMSEARSQSGVDISDSFDALTVNDSSPEMAERQAGHGGTGPAVAPGQDAGDHMTDKDAQFLHTLFCCPITKVWM